MATMAEQIDEHRKMISDLTARIEGIEQRQAKLACADRTTDKVAEDKTYDRQEWEDLACDLGFAICTGGGNTEVLCSDTGNVMLLFGPDATEKHTKQTQAMLHGLACLECNGCVRFGDRWKWDRAGSQGIVLEHGYSDSHPAALIAMLKAYRGQS